MSCSVLNGGESPLVDLFRIATENGCGLCPDCPLRDPLENAEVNALIRELGRILDSLGKEEK